MNKELLNTLTQLCIGVGIIMILIIAACLVTPKIARLLEKKFPRLKEPPERVDNGEQGISPENEIKGPYDSSKLENFDPNYKIYHEDIYGVDFKHGKKK